MGFTGKKVLLSESFGLLVARRKKRSWWMLE